MQDFKYNIIDKIINRKMKRVKQIVENVEQKTYSIQDLMQLSHEMEYLSSSAMIYFKVRNKNISK